MKYVYLICKDLKNNLISTIEYELDDSNSLVRCFMCPGFLNESLYYLIPVISLDACILRSDAKGTLYFATTSSPLNKIYTVVTGISAANECSEEWIFFNLNLKIAVPVLDTKDHAIVDHFYNKLSFISNRENCIIHAFITYLPTCIIYIAQCAIHIRRSVFTLYSF
jgi:hypothetical protein